MNTQISKQKHTIREQQRTEGIQHMNLDVPEVNKEIRYRNN